MTARAPLPPRIPAREIIVRTTSFSFHMGARVDDTWPRLADETRTALGLQLPVLLEEEDTTVPVLTRELGVRWPEEPVEFDAVLGGAEGPCDPKLPRVVDVSHGEARTFFGCVLQRSFARLSSESTMVRGIASVSGDGRGASLYGCIAAYAVSAVLVARAAGKDEARAVEAGLAGQCEPQALSWVARDWIQRVREEESAEAFGARGAREVLAR